MVWDFFNRFDLQKIVKLIGCSDVAVQICGIIIYALVVITKSEDLYNTLKDNNFVWNVSSDCLIFWKDENKTETSCIMWSEMTGMTTGVSGLLIHFVELYVASILLKGIKMRNHLKCETWVQLSKVLASLEAILVAGGLALNEMNALTLSYSIPSILYKVGSLRTVNAYAIEVRRTLPLSPLVNQRDVPALDDPNLTDDTNPLLS